MSRSITYRADPKMKGELEFLGIPVTALDNGGFTAWGIDAATIARAERQRIVEALREEAETHLNGRTGSGEACDALRAFADKLEADTQPPESGVD